MPRPFGTLPGARPAPAPAPTQAELESADAADRIRINSQHAIVGALQSVNEWAKRVWRAFVEPTHKLAHTFLKVTGLRKALNAVGLKGAVDRVSKTYRNSTRKNIYIDAPEYIDYNNPARKPYLAHIAPQVANAIREGKQNIQLTALPPLSRAPAPTTPAPAAPTTPPPAPAAPTPSPAPAPAPAPTTPPAGPTRSSAQTAAIDAGVEIQNKWVAVFPKATDIGSKAKPALDAADAAKAANGLGGTTLDAAKQTTAQTKLNDLESSAAALLTVVDELLAKVTDAETKTSTAYPGHALLAAITDLKGAFTAMRAKIKDAKDKATAAKTTLAGLTPLVIDTPQHTQIKEAKEAAFKAKDATNDHGLLLKIAIFTAEHYRVSHA